MSLKEKKIKKLVKEKGLEETLIPYIIDIINEYQDSNSWDFVFTIYTGKEKKTMVANDFFKSIDIIPVKGDIIILKDKNEYEVGESIYHSNTKIFEMMLIKKTNNEL